ncbi:MAG: PAS domain-containing protein [Alphaproteobacteria bacterium]|nr:PAS domain-containing protein [Alphaproteobacteria bacterium]
MFTSTGSTILTPELIADPSLIPIESNVIRDALRYWNDRRPCPDSLPGRQHIDPTDIPRLLQSVWLLDVVRDDPDYPRMRFRCRIFGGHFLDSWGLGMKGRFLDTVTQFAGSDGEEDLIATCESGVPRHYNGVPSVDPFTMVKQVEALMLPLASDGKTVDMMLNFSFCQHSENAPPSLINH